MQIKYLSLIIFLLLSFTGVGQEKTNEHSISYYAGSGTGGHDMLQGKHYYVGIDQSVWKFVYASTQISLMHARNQHHFEQEDVYLDEHSYNLMMQFDANLRIKLGPITITPHAGIIARYSDEVRYLAGSNQPPKSPLDEFISYRQQAFSGFSYGKAIGFNLEFMIFDHTSFGIRTDFQEFNNHPTGLSTVAFQIRTNFSKLINELKNPITTD